MFSSGPVRCSVNYLSSFLEPENGRRAINSHSKNIFGTLFQRGFHPCELQLRVMAITTQFTGFIHITPSFFTNSSRMVIRCWECEFPVSAISFDIEFPLFVEFYFKTPRFSRRGKMNRVKQADDVAEGTQATLRIYVFAFI